MTREEKLEKKRLAGRRYHKEHREEIKARAKQYYYKNRVVILAKSRLKLYGVKPEDFNNMIEKQNGVCGICKRTGRSGRLAVDHNHMTGKVRGLLCYRCNYTLGMLEKGWLRDALSYLKGEDDEESLDRE